LAKLAAAPLFANFANFPEHLRVIFPSNKGLSLWRDMAILAKNTLYRQIIANFAI
jgi:hypothetical protein